MPGRKLIDVDLLEDFETAALKNSYDARDAGNADASQWWCWCAHSIGDAIDRGTDATVKNCASTLRHALNDAMTAMMHEEMAR